jgi:hypothetical protein
MLSTSDVKELLAVELIGMVPDDETIITNTNRGYPPHWTQSRAPGWLSAILPGAYKAKACPLCPWIMMGASWVNWLASSAPEAPDMSNFLDRILGRSPSSAQTAKDRMKLVLSTTGSI